jgi:RNA polymerase sigma factor (TIGR02999 family)
LLFGCAGVNFSIFPDLAVVGEGTGKIRSMQLKSEAGLGIAGLWWFLAMSDVMHMVSAIEQGEPLAAEELLPLVYPDVRRLAAQMLAREAPGQSLQASDLVHEAYLRLVRENVQKHWDGRAHFFAAAAEAMRRILVENARRKKRLKHGGGRSRVELEAVGLPAKEPSEDLEALDEALNKLAEEDPAKAELVKLRFFAGLTMPEIARVLKISLATAERHWTYARTWLYAEVKERGDSANP